MNYRTATVLLLLLSCLWIGALIAVVSNFSFYSDMLSVYTNHRHGYFMFSW